MRDLLAPFGIEPFSAGELDLAEPEETGTTFPDECTHQGAAAARASGLAGIRRRFRPGGRCAQRRARYLLGALGRPGQKLRHAPWRRSTPSCARAAHWRRRNAVRILSPRCASHGPTATSSNLKPGSTARWSGHRAASTVLDMIRCSFRTVIRAHSARWRARRSTACRPRGAACRIGRVRSSSSRRRVLVSEPFGVYIHWPFCLSKCPYCDFNSHVRAAAIDQPLRGRV